MSKVTPSAFRGLSVAAGTVGLAAAGAAAMAGQACAAQSLTSGLAGNGLPVSTNAVPAVFGALAHNHGTIAGIPLSNLPVISDLPVTRSRPLPDVGDVRTTHVAQHAAPMTTAPTHAAPAAPAPISAPASTPMQRPAPTAVPDRATAPGPKEQTGPLDNVTSALHGLPFAGLPFAGLPFGGLTGGLSSIGG